MKETNKIITFYSYKGGVGRTQLLSNLAAYLCYYENKKVLMIDWDLEAPGLDYYFSFDRKKIKRGLIEVFESYVELSKDEREMVPEDLPIFTESIHIIDTTSNGGCLAFIPAANYNNENYSHRITSFNWFEFYDQLGGKYYIEFIKKYLNDLNYDAIFIDSRTGMSDYLGICNIQLPEKNIIVVGASRQNMDGGYEIAQKIKESSYTKEVRPSPFILPIFSRIDTSEQEEYKKWRIYFQNKFSDLIKESTKNLNISDIITSTTIIYTTNLAYGEKLLFDNNLAEIVADSVEDKFINILFQLGFSEKVFAKRSNNLTSPPFIDPLFIGRDKEMESIYRKLFKENVTLLLVNGMGGVGKTSLAASYYHRYANEYENLAWLFNEKKIIDTLLQLAYSLQLIFDESAPPEVRLDILLSHLANLEAPSLLIIDGVNEMNDFQANYHLFRRLSNFHILLTTRIAGVTQVASLPLDALPYEQSLQLFMKNYTKHKVAENSLFEQLYTAVEGNTLVIELLAKNLEVLQASHSDYGLAQLVTELQRGVLQISQSKPVVSTYHSKPLFEGNPIDIIAAMYNLGELIAAEKRLLSILSVLPAESIHFFTIQSLLPSTQQLGGILLNLSRKGWIAQDKNRSAYKVSPVVQEIVRNKNQDLWEDCTELVDTLIEKLDYDGQHIVGSSYQEAAIFTRFGEAVVDNLNHNNNTLGILLERLGCYHQTTGNLPKALQVYTKQSNLYQQLFESYPDNVTFKNGLAISCEKLGQVHADMGNLPGAKEFYLQQNRLSKELFEAYPDDVALKKGLAISYEKLGQVHADMGNLPSAKEFYLQQSQLFKELFEAYPDNVSFKYGLAISYSKLGQISVDLGNFDAALVFYQQQTILFKGLFEANPDSVSFKSGLAISYEKLGQTDASMGNFSKALEFYQEQNKLSRELFEAYPDNVSFKNGLAISYEKLGHIYTSMGNFSKALELYELDVKLTKELFDAFPDNVGFKNGLAISYFKLGQTYANMENFEKALWLFVEQVKLFEQLAEDYPDVVNFKSNLAKSYSVLAKVYETHDSRRAQEYFSMAKKKWQELVEKYPEYESFKQEYSLTKNSLIAIESKNTSQLKSTKPEIFFSYAWNSEKSEFPISLYEALKIEGYKIVMDRYDVAFRESFTEFIQRIGTSAYIIIVISDKYLRSPYCMFELLEIYRRSNSELSDMITKVFPIVMSDADIYTDEGILEYVKYWRQKSAYLHKGMSDEIDLLDTADLGTKLKKYNEITNQFTNFALWLNDMNTLSPTKIAENDFQVLKDAITRYATKDIVQSGDILST